MGENIDDAADSEEVRALPSAAELLRTASPAHIDPVILDLYSVWDYRHAGAILKSEFPSELGDLMGALYAFRFTDEQVLKGGGNESDMPKNISNLLRPRGWKEDTFQARMLMDDLETQVSTHKIDYVKGRVAFEFEWNAKDQTFDRDLAAFRGFFDYGRISVGVLLTRDTSLNSYFTSLGHALKADGSTETHKDGRPRKVIEKYGASTTHTGKLLPRLRAGRSGGCPILAFGITKALRKTPR